MRFIISAILTTLAISPAPTGEAASETHAKTIAPYVDQLTFAVAHVDLSRLNLDALAKRVEAVLGERGIAEGKAVAELFKATFVQSGGKDVYVLMNWADSLDEVLVLAPVGKGGSAKAIAALLSQIPGFKAEARDRLVVAGPPNLLARLKDFQPQPVPELAKAFSATGEGSVQGILLVPVPLRRALLEMFPMLPREIGGGKSADLNLRWAAAEINLADKVTARLIVQAEDAAAAGTVARVLDRSMALLARSREVKDAFPGFPKLVAQLKPASEGDRLVLVLDEKKLDTLVVPLLARQSELGLRQRSMNNLRQIGIGWHTLGAVNKNTVLRASHDAGGKPLLSWRVHILPFLEQEPLYNEFRLNEPWDSEHNKKLIARMPAVFRNPALTNLPQGKTTYLAPAGPGTLFEGNKGVRLDDIPDGSSNTILAVEAEASRAVFWTQPEDFKVDLKEPLAGLLSPGAKGFLAIFADGSTHFIPATIKAATLRALFTPDGKEPPEEIP